ncbi:3-hydroxyisobutyrate dehydrogenase-like beta-hydroxyacid dehydrogenase [Crossiella equi]|uniref:3-hydroxyisobutyrate dehydrogenase-like beta-hydroxyacid dehydrogenase n=1 Tax=Crossiella equi TaxID=130796 RepID=A0ABS5AQC2_9PSEU|nr:3-hydroxyisobutyrate dehydrogenase-like beta-hydroxyacid dehydrogenase [Crossiella equi]
MTTIGFLGLGTMGAPMAVNLVRAGHRVTGYDLAGPGLARLREAGGATAALVAAARPSAGSWAWNAISGTPGWSG